jgi:hypothetical protein
VYELDKTSIKILKHIECHEFISADPKSKHIDGFFHDDIEYLLETKYIRRNDKEVGHVPGGMPTYERRLELSPKGRKFVESYRRVIILRWIPFAISIVAILLSIYSVFFSNSTDVPKCEKYNCPYLQEERKSITNN